MASRTHERMWRARSSRAPQSSAPCVRQNAQSGRIAPRDQAAAFSRDAHRDNTSYRPAYVPGSQGAGANGAYGRQTAASQYSRNNPNYSAARKMMGAARRSHFGVVIAILVVAVGGGSAFAMWKNSINDQLTKATKSTRKSWPSTTRSKPKGHDVHRAVL